MTDEWRRHAVSDLIQAKALEIGDGYRATNSELSRTGLPFARAGNIGDGFWFSGVDCLPEDKARQLGKKISRPGDAVFTSKGTVGRFAFVKDDTPRFVYSPQLCYWRSLDADILDARFLYYWMASHEFRSQVDIVAGQTDMAEYVNLRDQRRMHITAPPVSEQRAIGHVLGALDDKIDLNRRMVETLDAMAQALFKSWFVDFDPVRAKMQDRYDTGRTEYGADPFPDSLVRSEIGDVPEGWQVVPVAELIEVNPTRRLRKREIAPYVDMANMPMSGHTPYMVTERPYGSGTRFINGDTLVARITPCLENGKTAYVDFLEPNATGWGSTEFIVMRPRPPLPNVFAYCLARSPRFRAFLIRNMSGTSGRQRVPPQVLSQYRVPAPGEQIARTFEQMADPLIARASAAARESRRLADVRDALLPELVSGRRRVEDWRTPVSDRPMAERRNG